MAKKNRSVHVCRECGFQTLKWLGRCPGCGRWNTMVEEASPPPGTREEASSMTEPMPVQEIPMEPVMRLRSGLEEFDRTLGGGLVPGSLVLIGGDPGIGKSTLVLQVLHSLALEGHVALYLSGEESPQQIKLRADRLGVAAENLFIVAGTCLEEFLQRLETLGPALAAVDSIQTLYTQSLASAPGSVGQVREVASRLMMLAKKSGVPMFIIGHVTKEGAIAGPKVLEHMVDTVLYFEGEGGHAFRVLRAVKNRFGPTNEIGVFEMKDSGLEPVGNPSKLFLQERPQGVSGSVVIPCVEGTRPVLVEIQGLVGRSPLGMPRRTAIGVDSNRISLLVAVLGKRMGLELGDRDIFVNVAGGLKVDEPAADLGIISAMMSSYLDRPVERNLVVFGEVGLAGEIRGVSRPEMRIREAEKLGFSRCILPASNLEGTPAPGNIRLAGVRSIREAFDELFQEF